MHLIIQALDMQYKHDVLYTFRSFEGKNSDKRMLDVSPHCAVHSRIDFPSRHYLKTITTLRKAINVRGTMFRPDRVVYVSVICYKSPQGLVGTIAHNHSKDRSSNLHF